MLEKTALSFYRTLVLTGVGFVAGAALMGIAVIRTHNVTPKDRDKNKAATEEPKTTY